MRDVFSAKLRCGQLFRVELIKSGDKLLVEARLDDYWGSGLTMSITATPNPKNYTGSNKDGQLLGELRRELKNNQRRDEETNIEHMDVAAAASNPELAKADLCTKEITSHDITPQQNVPEPLGQAVAKVGSQFRSYSISPSRLNDIKIKDNPIVKAFMKQQLKRQRESINSRDNTETTSVCLSTDSFTSAIDKTSDIAVIRDFDDQFSYSLLYIWPANCDFEFGLFYGL